MNPEDKVQDQDVATEAPKGPADEAPADPSLELGEIKLIKPLRITDEDLGGDPYNRTGRFTAKD